MHVRKLALMGMLIATLLVRPALADRLVLKNGTSVEGTVIKFGSEYRVRTADGQSRVIPEADVASVVKTAPGATTLPTAASGSASFNSTRSRAEAVDAPIVAVTMWEKFIEANPTSSDLAAAKTELEKWQKLHADDSERINGKWLGGDERKALLKQVEQLCSEAREQMENQTLQAIEKYEKVLKIYPNSYEANFAMGFVSLTKGTAGGGRGNMQELDKAIRSLEMAVKLRPNSPSALSNLAVGYSMRQRWEDSIMTAYKAAKIQDSKPVVETLINCLVRAPDPLKTGNARIRPIIQEAALLGQKYQIGARGTGRFAYLPPERIPVTVADGKQTPKAGIVGNGSGFVISSDGYIITNRHVVNDKGHIFRVRFDDGVEKSAEVVAIDTQFDIALIKIKPDRTLPFLKVAAADLPNPAAKCMVLGYPVAAMLDFKMQVTSGEVTSTNADDDYQVTLTANTTRGNSGGPIVDRDGNVIGVLSAGATAFNATYIKAVSAGQIRGFLNRVKDKHKTTFPTGAATDTAFDGEKLAKEARTATVLILIIRGDGRDVPASD